MFIDEGFGSLDEESLQQAVRVLSELGEGRRLVGIISHVHDLKNRIDRQIVVTKDRSGHSSVKIMNEHLLTDSKLTIYCCMRMKGEKNAGDRNSKFI